MVTPVPSDTIKILEAAAKPKTFAKQVCEADTIICDISQFNVDLEEAEHLIKALKNSEGCKEQVLILVSSPMAWSNTCAKPGNKAYTD